MAGKGKIYRDREYYIRFDTYWQGSADRWVGPFASRSQANTEIERATKAEGSLAVQAGRSPSNIKYAIRVWGVQTRSEARRYGMREGENTNIVGTTIPLNTDELFDIEWQN